MEENVFASRRKCLFTSNKTCQCFKFDISVRADNINVGQIHKNISNFQVIQQILSLYSLHLDLSIKTALLCLYQ